ncbi:hypothetical protein BCR44DRAFT_1487275 [Catenaria anguillulae PL171]|uniref:C2H2-type domain-containing protein n=1 Tax=Catenaria anguillulae PL171 TaxID=765915 RepID=A0A1Y2HCN9_9FUNG|nr:hypothetical protein BCR44DRAFT_1487275 [Catenaria anguillulae PL171]
MQTDEFGRSRPAVGNGNGMDQQPVADLRLSIPRRPRRDSDMSDSTPPPRPPPFCGPRSPTSGPGHRDRDRPAYREQRRGSLQDPMTLDYLVDWKTYAAWLRSKKELAERPANREEDEAQYQEILARYDAYKTQWIRGFQRKFFLAHEQEDWVVEKYHPEVQAQRREGLGKMKAMLFEKFMVDLPAGKYDAVDLDQLPEHEPMGVEAEIADRAEQALRTLHIKSIPLSVKRADLHLAFAEMPGYTYLTLSEPRVPATTDRHGPFVQSNMSPHFALGPRTGWVVFASVAEAEAALAEVKKYQDLMTTSKAALAVTAGDQGLDFSTAPAQTTSADSAAFAMTGVPEKFKVLHNLTIGIVPVGAPKFRTTVSEAFAHADRVLLDLEQVKSIAVKLDAEYGLQGVALLAERFPTATEKQCLDKLIQYLRKVHLYCYYSAGVEAESMEELAWKCGDKVFRKPGECDLSSDRMLGFLAKFDSKIKLRFDAPTQPEGLAPLGALSDDQAVDLTLQKFVAKQGEGRFRCDVSGCEKLFRDTGFVIKHIKNKHAEAIQGEIEAVIRHNKYINAFLLDPHHLMPRDPSGNQGAMGQFSSTTPFRPPGYVPTGPMHHRGGPRGSDRYHHQQHDDRGGYGGGARGIGGAGPRSPREFAVAGVTPAGLDARSMDPRGIKYYTDLDAPVVVEGDVVLDYD